MSYFYKKMVRQNVISQVHIFSTGSTPDSSVSDFGLGLKSRPGLAQSELQFPF
jgi:hypothetical protein